MNGDTTRNLDLMAARTAHRILEDLVTGTGKEKQDQAKSLDNVATKALGVFQENGVYAGMLYLLSASQDANMACTTARKLTELTGSLPFNWKVPEGEAAATLAFYSETVCDQLDRLLLTKGLFEQTLVYVRYGAKARYQEGRAEAPAEGPGAGQDEAGSNAPAEGPRTGQDGGREEDAP